MGPRVKMDAVEKSKISFASRISNLGHPPCSRHNTDWAIPAPMYTVHNVLNSILTWLAKLILQVLHYM
jgi:hypothetical protein